MKNHIFLLVFNMLNSFFIGQIYVFRHTEPSTMDAVQSAWKQPHERDCNGVSKYISLSGDGQTGA